MTASWEGNNLHNYIFVPAEELILMSIYTRSTKTYSWSPNTIVNIRIPVDDQFSVCLQDKF